MIQTVGQGELVRTFYKHPTLVRGVDVRFSYWNENGLLLGLDLPATVEIPDTGMYYLEIIAPLYDTFLLFEGNTDGVFPVGENSSVEVVKVGNPITKAFYWDAEGAEGDISFEFFDDVGDTIESGNMTNLGNAFYSIPTISIVTPWFLEVDGNILIKNP